MEVYVLLVAYGDGNPCVSLHSNPFEAMQAANWPSKVELNWKGRQLLEGWSAVADDGKGRVYRITRKRVQ